MSNAAAIGGANGLTDYLTPEVSVRMDMDDGARVRTAALEILDKLDTRTLPDGDPPGLDRRATRDATPTAAPITVAQPTCPTRPPKDPRYETAQPEPAA
ncbi:MAG TPA: hypothetical protein VFZ85_03160 [Jiangellaceae bacterium]